MEKQFTSPGVHTFAEFLDKSGIVCDQAYDRRRVTVGGLTFDDPTETFVVPEAAKDVTVVEDGKSVAVFTVQK